MEYFHVIQFAAEDQARALIDECPWEEAELLYFKFKDPTWRVTYKTEQQLTEAEQEEVKRFSGVVKVLFNDYPGKPKKRGPQKQFFDRVDMHIWLPRELVDKIDAKCGPNMRREYVEVLVQRDLAQNS